MYIVLIQYVLQGCQVSSIAGMSSIKYTVIYGVGIRFWTTLQSCNHDPRLNATTEGSNMKRLLRAEKATEGSVIKRQQTLIYGK